MAANGKYELKLGAATREAFGKALLELGKENPNVVCCDADLSKSTYTHWFGQEFPGRFFSCGIAESNMVSIGAGMAASGKIAFVASFSAFVINKLDMRQRFCLHEPARRVESFKVETQQRGRNEAVGFESIEVT